MEEGIKNNIYNPVVIEMIACENNTLKNTTIDLENKKCGLSFYILKFE